VVYAMLYSSFLIVLAIFCVDLIENDAHGIEKLLLKHK
jgi:hypothetical protein